MFCLQNYRVILVFPNFYAKEFKKIPQGKSLAGFSINIKLMKYRSDLLDYQFLDYRPFSFQSDAQRVDTSDIRGGEGL